jgi:endonuclease/exonuclease/phosphatase family metal-dependent hydrolase
VRVLALNVQSFRAGVDRVVEVIRATDPDAALLVEVRLRPGRRLARLTGRRLVFGRTVRFRRFGNAVLLREPPASARTVVLSRARGLEPRGAVIVTGTDGVTFVATHLGVPADARERDARELVRIVDGVQPVVIGGDLNDRPDGPATHLLLERFTDVFAGAGEGSGETFPATAPQHRIDYLLCSPGLTPVRAAVVPIVASDHLAVVADLDVNAGA